MLNITENQNCSGIFNTQYLFEQTDKMIRDLRNLQLKYIYLYINLCQRIICRGQLMLWYSILFYSRVKRSFRSFRFLGSTSFVFVCWIKGRLMNWLCLKSQSIIRYQCYREGKSHQEWMENKIFENMISISTRHWDQLFK